MQRYGFKFHGNAKEFFGIWIVNVLLSVITVGIYSAWAKVRTKKYFYGNTELDNHNFDYHATGGQIFKGRLIAGGLYVVFMVASSFAPPVAGILAIGFIFLLPWFLILSMRFNARVSSYRNVGFNFVGKYPRALWLWMALPVIIYIVAIAIIAVGFVLVTQMFLPTLTAVPFVIAGLAVLFIGFAYVQRGLMEFYVNKHAFAGRAFEAKIALKPILIAYVAFLGFLVAAGALFGVVAGAFVGGDIVQVFDPYSAPDPAKLITLLILFYVFLFVVVVPASSFIQAYFRNIMWNNSSFNGNMSFNSNLSPVKFFWIVMSNLVVTVLTLGLMRPWAMVRQARYVASCSALSTEATLDGFVGEVKAAGNAGASEYMDFEGIDLGVGV